MNYLAQTRIKPTGTDNVLLCRLSDFPLRFQKHVEAQVNGCWLWTGSASGPPGFPQHAYGRYFATIQPLRSQIAHRFAYEFATGRVIPKPLELDHLCKTKLCVNPAHLEVVTHQENCQRRKRSGPFPKAVRYA